MKATRWILKVITAVLALAAVVCCVIAFWDKIEAAICCVKEKLCGAKCCCSEYDDYMDWDDE